PPTALVTLSLHDALPISWRTCTLQSVQTSTGQTVTFTGALYIRESSDCWELSGQLNTSVTADFKNLIIPALIPTGISRPKQNTYAAGAQTFGATSAGGIGRIALMANGGIEYANNGNVNALYVNTRFVKSPHNT